MSLRYKDKEGNETLVAGGPFSNTRTWVWINGAYTTTVAQVLQKYSITLPPGKTIIGNCRTNTGTNPGKAYTLTASLGTKSNIDACESIAGWTTTGNYEFVICPFAFTNTTNADQTVWLGYQTDTAVIVKLSYTIF